METGDAQAATEETKDDEKTVPETPEPVKEKVKDSWDATSSEDESEEPEPPKVAVAVATTQKQVSVEKVESPEDSETESSDGSDESDSEDDDDDADTGKTDAEIKKEKAWERIMVRSHFGCVTLQLFT